MTGSSGRRKLVVAAALAVGAMTVGACSSSSSSGTSGGSPGSSSTPAAGGSSAPTDAGLAAAQAATAANEKLPTVIPASVPLKTTPAKGKTFVWLQCETPECAEATASFKQAIAAVGWNLKTVSFVSTDPSTLLSGLQQALQYHPVAVSFVGLPYAVWKSAVPEYKSAGVPIITWSTGPQPVNSTLPTQVAENQAETGKMLADWFISDSKGTGKAMFVGVPTFPTLAAAETGFKNEVAANCSGCSVKYEDLSYPTIAAGKGVSSVVSAIARDPGVQYVINSEGALFTPLSAALSSAGVTGIKIAGASIESADRQLINSGKEAAGIPQQVNYAAWAMVDAALRVSEHMPATSENFQWTVITTAQKLPVADTWDYPSDWQNQYKQLWKVS